MLNKLEIFAIKSNLFLVDRNGEENSLPINITIAGLLWSFIVDSFSSQEFESAVTVCRTTSRSNCRILLDSFLMEPDWARLKTSDFVDAFSQADFHWSK